MSNLSNNEAALSQLLFRAIDQLFFNNQKACTFGLLIGWSLHILSKPLGPILLLYTGFDLSVISLLEWLILGFTAFNIPHLIKRDLPKDLEAVLLLLRYIERKSNLSDTEKRQFYRKVIQKYIDGVAFDQIEDEDSEHPKMTKLPSKRKDFPDL